jgi:UDP:flavonoid glycosyltransferase YjiC (YdhE family)
VSAPSPTSTPTTRSPARRPASGSGSTRRGRRSLLQLGAGNINDVGSLVGMVTERLLRGTGLQVCVTRSIIAGESAGLAGEVHTIRGVYPLARYFAAFDLAVAAAGYNTFHELLAAGLPTLFVPNHETAADDQAARSRYAQEAGVAFDVPDPTPEPSTRR